MVPIRLITKINFGRNGNHTFFVSGDTGLSVNQVTGFLAEKVHVPNNIYKDSIIIIIINRYLSV
jgi:pyrroloquinoline quinone (PQQ) biosynthesis protein C